MSDYKAPDNSLQRGAPSYRLPVEDTDFLSNREEMRGLRFALEYTKADLTLRDWGVRSTIIVFGSARIPSPELAAARIAAAAPGPARAEAEKLGSWSRYYQEARAFAHLVSVEGGAMKPIDGQRDNVIATGGGPGIMEAANVGAFEGKSLSIGLNIQLPHEQHGNPWQDMGISFKYFFNRKLAFVRTSSALVCMPGGFGTLDELFEVLTLVQTKKAKPVPIVLFGTAFWKQLVNFDALVEQGTVSPEDLKLFHYTDDPAEAWGIIRAGQRKQLDFELATGLEDTDYAAIARQNPELQGAQAALVWTGSWYEADVALDPWQRDADDPALFATVEAALERARRMGHDLRVQRAVYVPVALALLVCAKPGYERGHVKAAVLRRLVGRRRAGRAGCGAATWVRFVGPADRGERLRGFDWVDEVAAAARAPGACAVSRHSVLESSTGPVRHCKSGFHVRPVEGVGEIGRAHV